MAGHESVLLKEAIEGLALKPEGIYVDATFGRGGHSRAILQQLNEKGRLIAIDKDKEAMDYAGRTFHDDKRFSMVCASFAKMADITKAAGVYGQVNGILLDLGVSSPQLDNPERGFSFQHSGPLDMRMNTHQKQTAADFINHAKVEEMEAVFYQYGEERFARRIAQALGEARKKEQILTTGVLAEIVKKAHPKWEKHKHPATRVFQAIRIHINQELQDLQEGLKQSITTLAVKGRLAVISFHSLEDRIVKHFMQEQERGPSLPPCIPVRATELKSSFKRVGRAVKPDASEIQRNPRARSAVLRIGEKIA